MNLVWRRTSAPQQMLQRDSCFLPEEEKTIHKYQLECDNLCIHKCFSMIINVLLDKKQATKNKQRNSREFISNPMLSDSISAKTDFCKGVILLISRDFHPHPTQPNPLLGGPDPYSFASSYQQDQRIRSIRSIRAP